MEFLVAALILWVVIGFRRIAENERAIITRFGKRHTAGPGLVWHLPFVERLQKISLEPFDVSLPPQSAITKDEIPIQLQASLVADVVAPELAVTLPDWRIFLMGRLQELMKERLEDLDFDNLNTVFPDWVDSIHSELQQKATKMGVRIKDLRISNLSPRTRPQR